MSEPLLKHPAGWGFTLAAVLVAVLVTVSYVGGFFDPQGNMRDLPLVLVNEDAGAMLNDEAVNLGEQIVARLTQPESALGDTVAWTVLPSRDDAVRRLGEDAAYAAIVIPGDYSARVAALFDPVAGPSRAAEIEVLTSPASGSFAGSASQQIAVASVAEVSAETGAQLAAALGAAGASIPVEAAPIVANPVQPTITVAQPVGQHSGRGLAPFYFAVMLAIAGYMIVSIVNLAVDVVAGTAQVEFLAWRYRRPDAERSRLAIWRAKLVLSVAAAVGAGAVTTWVAVSPLDMDAAKGLQLGFFAVLALAAITAVSLAFLTAFGQPGLVVAVLVTVIYAVPAAGGVYPREMMPGLFRSLGWLPLRSMVDGARSLMFFDGRSEAGLGAAIWVLAAYGLGAAVVGGATALGLDRAAARHAASSARVAIMTPRPAA